MARSEKQAARTRVTVDLDPADAERLAEVRRLSVYPPSRSAVVRVALRRGLDDLLRNPSTKVTL